MTSIWGPLGWITLHSVATLYPENPTQAERDLVSSWLEMFRDTITCAHCKSHFGTVLQTYQKLFPNMMASRQEFAMFTFRVHNAVNRRLNKPVQMTLGECMEKLRATLKTRSASEYRKAYLNHIMRYWASLQDISGIVASRKVREMRKIEVEYLVSRDTNFNVTLTPDPVVLPTDVLEKRSEPPPHPMRLARDSQTVAGFRITPKGIRLR